MKTLYCSPSPGQGGGEGMTSILKHLQDALALSLRERAGVRAATAMEANA